MLLRHLRYLLAIAEHGNFTRAAEALHVSQPTLSLQIRQLEESLGVQLLDRSGRTVRPTDMGAVYIEQARRAMRELAAGERAIHDVQTLDRGTLRLAMTPTLTPYLSGPLVAAFHARHAGIVLHVDEMPLDSMVQALIEDRLDLGMAFSTSDAEELECQPLFKEKLAVVVRAEHPLARRRTALTPAMLHGAPMALLNASFATRSHAHAYFQAHGVAPHVAIETNTIIALLEIIRRQDIATILPRAIVTEQRWLRALRLTPPLAERIAALLYRRGSYRSAAASAFTALVRDWQPPG